MSDDIVNPVTVWTEDQIAAGYRYEDHPCGCDVQLAGQACRCIQARRVEYSPDPDLDETQPLDMDARLPAELDYKIDRIANDPLRATSSAEEQRERHARQDTIDDVEIWLNTVEDVLKAGELDKGFDPNERLAVEVADDILAAFRSRWPRRDGKSPLPG